MKHQDPYKRMVNQMKYNAELVNYPPKIYDPYEAIGSPLRVHHPVQPKTQVEMWRDEIDRNYDAIDSCPCDIQHCTKQGTDNCEQRIIKNIELNNLISQATQPIHPRYPTGTFTDDYPKHRSGLSVNPLLEVTLLDKIKLWLAKKIK